MVAIQKKLIIVMAVMVAVAIATGGLVQVSNAQSICNMSTAGLLACKPSVTPPNPTPPSAACCTALTHADLHCLCSYKNSNLLPSLGIDPNLALQLPKKCKLPKPANC